MSQYTKVYRGVLRELRKAAPKRPSPVIMLQFRTMVEKARECKDDMIFQDVQNGLLYLKSQREHGILVERYNPTAVLTEQERIRKTANRVGLNVPKTVVSE